MVGNNMLNNIVNANKIYDPAQILYEMDRGIKSSLNQENSESEDGMDMSVCMIDTQKNELVFAGAIRPLVIIQNEELRIIEGDIYGIGGLEFSKRKKEFTTKSFNLTNDTSIYMFSDGYCDQLGVNRKKFMLRNFTNLLTQIQGKSMEAQCDDLETAFENHKGNVSQVDDILIMGIKI